MLHTFLNIHQKLYPYIEVIFVTKKGNLWN